MFEQHGPQVTVAGAGEISEGRATDESLMLHPHDEGVPFDFPIYVIRFVIGAGQPEDLGNLLGCAPLDGSPRWGMSGYLGDAARVYAWRVPRIWDETPGATYVLEASGGYSPDSRQLICQGDTLLVADIWLEAHRPANQ